MLRGYTAEQPLTSLALWGNQVAAAEKSGLTWFWDSQSGLPNITLQTASSANVAFSADGKWLAAAQDNKIQVWDWAHGLYRMLQPVTGISDPSPLGAIRRLAFSPDGRWLVSASSGSIALVLWDALRWVSKTVVVTQDSSSSGVYSAVFSRDSQLLAYRTSTAVQVWNIATQTNSAIFPITAAANPNAASLQALAFSPDGHLIAFADGKTVRVWNVATQKVVDLIGHLDTVYNIAFSPDGTLLASASADGTARLWNVAIGSLITTLQPNTGRLFDVAFSSDGTTLASASDSGVVFLWQVLR